eukprot:4927642-Pyramimonas_sp.AAC.1
MRTATGLLEVSGSLSNVLASGESILAGRAQSVPWVKCYLYGVLEKARNTIPEGLRDLPPARAPIRSYFDDTT